jgi:hypothetical protein
MHFVSEKKKKSAAPHANLLNVHGAVERNLTLQL